MKKLLLLLLAISLFSCEKEECFGKAEVITPLSFPKSMTVDKMPKNCEDGSPDMEYFNSKYGNSLFVRWI